MTGLESYGFPIFDAAAEDLRSRGIDVISPSELDDPETRSLAMASKDGSPGIHNGHTWGDYICRDLKVVIDEVDGVIVLDNWRESDGARLEVFAATLRQKPIYRYIPGALLEQLPTDEIGEGIWQQRRMLKS